MKRFWLSIGFLATLSGVVAGNAYAQSDRQDSQSSSNQSSSSSRESRSSDENRSGSSGSQNNADERSRQSSANDFDDEYRLRYNDEKNRLSIDVDEDIRFRDNEARRNWARDGEFDLRYDSDRNDVRAAGEGTIDVDRAAGALSQWWQSWWDDERQARRSRQEGADRGTYEFIRQHDSNNDGYLARQEVPERYRRDFATVDRNDDGYLSRSEFRQYGDHLFDSRRSSSNQSYAGRSSQSNQNDQTWSEWWSSWWSDNDQSGRNIEAGAQQFIRQHDRNNDGYLTRRELPQRMQDEFYRVDSNGDEYLSRSEIRQRGSMLRDSSESNQRSTAQRSNQRSSSANQNDQTWSEWWSSWWSDDSGRQQTADTGAREFIQRHDQNNDGYLVRSEMPQRMYDEFARIDANGDRYLSRTEIARRVDQSRLDRRNMASNERSDGQSNAQGWAVGVVYLCDECFARLDRDKDRELSRSEAQNSVFANRFNDFDGNDDGYLTKNEIRRSVEQQNESQRASNDSDYSRDNDSRR